MTALRRALLAAALVLTPFAPTAPAQAADEPLLTDPADDTELHGGELGGAAPVPYSGEQTGAADLLSLSAAETDETILLTLAVKSLEGDFTGADHEIAFSFGGSEFLVTIGYYVNPGGLGGGQYGWLMYGEDGDFYHFAGLQTTVDAAAGTLAAEVPKHYLFDANGRTPGRGDALEGFTVASERVLDLFADFVAPRVHDEMGVEAPGSLVLEKGDYATGSLLLSADQRIRVSNGGATTFVFQVAFRNVGEASEAYAATIDDAPEGWDVRIQSPVRVDAGSVKLVPVLASVPFAHDHGGFDSFNLTVKSERDPSTEGRMRLGVVHTPIPQPAGHHPDLYLHSPKSNGGLFEPFEQVFGFSWGYMNTDPDHASDRADVEPSYQMEGADVWSIGLSPSLETGLDFDVAQTGTLDGALIGAFDGAATVRAQLWWYGWKDGDSTSVLLAEGEPVEVELVRDAPVPFSTVVTPTPESDYLPFQADQSVWLELVVEGGMALPPMPFLLDAAPKTRLSVADFHLKLPLQEYHDRLTGVAEAASSLELTAVGEVEKLARPGNVAAYEFDLKNVGNEEVSVELDVAGGDALLGTLVPDGVVRLGAGESRRLTLGVAVPDQAAEGQQLEVLVFAHAVDDPSRSAVARTKTTVTGGAAAAPDESGTLLAAQHREQETPGPAVGALLVALAVAALAGRRGRRGS